MQVVFDDISSLRIYNKYELVKTNILAIDELVDKVALSVNTTVDAIEIIFWPETILKIGLHETDFNGPEAAQFISSEGNRVVWN